MKEITRGILENASEGLCLLNQSGKIELCNSLFLKMTGIKERDIQEKIFKIVKRGRDHLRLSQPE